MKEMAAMVAVYFSVIHDVMFCIYVDTLFIL